MAKNVVITGATSGIGEAIARAYLEKGENIVLTGRRTERLEVLKNEFSEAFLNQKVWTFPLDVTDMSMVKTICSEILETVGQVDILVNNAGLALGLAPYQDYEELDMLTMLDTNVFCLPWEQLIKGISSIWDLLQGFTHMLVQQSIQQPRLQSKLFQTGFGLTLLRQISR